MTLKQSTAAKWHAEWQGSPYSELQPGMLSVSSVVEHHAAADHKSVLLQQRIGDAVGVTMNGLLASLTLCQTLKPYQRQHLVKPEDTASCLLVAAKEQPS